MFSEGIKMTNGMKQVINLYLLLNPFQATCLFLYPLKTSKNLWVPDVFKGYTMGPVA